MKSFFANAGIGAIVALSGTYAYNGDSDRALALLVAAIGIYQLHKIERHLFHQTVLMVQEDDQAEYPDHPPYAIESEDDE